MRCHVILATRSTYSLISLITNTVGGPALICGGKTDQNSHPHFSMDKKTHLVHNGTLDNYKELKKELEAEGVEFSS